MKTIQTGPKWNFLMVIGCLGLVFSGPWGWAAIFVSYGLQSRRGDYSTFEGLMSLVGLFIIAMVVLIAICMVGAVLDGDAG